VPLPGIEYHFAVAQHFTIFSYLDFRQILMFRLSSLLHNCTPPPPPPFPPPSFFFFPSSYFSPPPPPPVSACAIDLAADRSLLLHSKEWFWNTKKFPHSLYFLFIFMWVFIYLCFWYVDYGIAIVVIRINSRKICREREKNLRIWIQSFHVKGLAGGFSHLQAHWCMC